MSARQELEELRRLEELEAKASKRSLPQDFAQGFNKGLAGMIDIAANPIADAMNFFGIPVPHDPTRAAFESIGIGTQPQGFVGRVGQEVGSAALPAGGLLGLAGRGAMGAAPIVQQIIANPGRFAAGELASAVAGGTGAAIASEVAPGNVVAEIIGQGVGGAAPGLLGAGIRGAMSSADAGTNLEAFQRAGVDPTAGQVSGNIGTQYVEGGLRAAPGSTGVMADVATKQANQLGTTVDDLATRLGGSTEEAAGRTIEKGVRGFVSREQQTASRLWGKLDTFIAPDAPVSLPNTKTVLSELSGQGKLTEAFTSPIIAKAVKATDGVSAVPYQELRDLRSLIGARLGEPDLVSDIPRTELKKLYSALSRDIKGAAADAGGLDAFERANKFTRALHQRVDDVLEPLMRRATPEKLYSAAVGGDASSLRALKRSLDHKSWKVVVGSVVKELGTARTGQQNAAGNAFSPETFLTEWNKLGPEVRKQLFTGPGFSTYEKDLNAIAKTAELMRANSRVMANPSGSAVLGINMGAAGLAGGAFLSGNVPLAAKLVTGAAAANGAARLFSSPKFVKWLAESQRAPVEQLPNLTARLVETMSGESDSLQSAVADYLENL